MGKYLSGTSIALPASFIAGSCDPVDARFVVENKSDLTTPSTFGTVGDYCLIYEGITVYVREDKAQYTYMGPADVGNGILSTEVSNLANWVKTSDSLFEAGNLALTWKDNKINLVIGEEIISSVDGSIFIKDGMLDNVDLNNHTLIFTFNTDSGKQNINIDLSEFIDVYVEGTGITINNNQISVDLSQIPEFTSLKSSINEHIKDTNNPHQVTASLIGTYTSTEIEDKLSSKADLINSKVDPNQLPELSDYWTESYGTVVGSLDIDALAGRTPTYTINGVTRNIEYDSEGNFKIEINEAPTDLSMMFAGELDYIRTLDMSTVGTYNTTSMNSLVMDTTGLEELNLGDMTFENVEDCEAVLNCTGNCDINWFFSGKYDLSNVKKLDYAFCENMSLVNVDLTPLNLVNCEDLRECFRGCTNLETIKCDTDMPNNRYGIDGLHHFPNLRKVEITGYLVLDCQDSMFISNPNLEELILSGYDITKRGTYMGGIFAYCPKLHTLDISGWDFKNITRASPTGLSNWVYQSPKLENIIGPVYNIKVNVSVSANPLLTKESLMVLINGLAEVTESRTITLGAVNKAKLTEEEIAIATNKGWTVA